MYGYVAVALIGVLVVKIFQPSRLDAISTVGSSTWLGSWWAGWKYASNALEVIQEGYKKYKSAPFKVAELRHWTVVLSSREHIEELKSAPDDVFSFIEALNDRLHTDYTIGAEIRHNRYHVPLVASKLTRNIEALYPEMRDELVSTLDGLLDTRDGEWKGVPVLSTVQKVICRTSNRMLVGLPLCRDPEWTNHVLRNIDGIGSASAIIGLFPDLLKPLAARFLTDVNQSNEHARELLRPVIEERKRNLAKYHGKEWIKPNDFLSWLMDEAEGPESSVRCLTARILNLNFAAIVTTSINFTHALFCLAANPQYIHPLRKEVEDIIQEEGWSKLAVSKMHRVDSFLKECQRLESVGGVSLIRKAIKDYTFADGTFVPKGTMIVAAARMVHLDEAYYENARAFVPFRFSDVWSEVGRETRQLVSTSPEHLTFGLGRHACPGRFFVASELKTMLAHIVMMYDIRLEGDRPPEKLRFATAILPSPTAKIMFRRRVD